MRAIMRALLLSTCCSALQTLSLQTLSPAVQRSIAQRQTLDTLQNAVSGAALWRQCFLEGRVPDETLDALTWPDARTRAACLVAFGPVARLVARHPRLADLALLALIDAATTTTDEEHVEPPLAPTVAAVSAVEAVYGDAAGPVIDALLDDEVAAWMGTAASQGSRGRFARRAGSFATLDALAKKLRDIRELVPLLESLGRRTTAEDGRPRQGSTRRPSSAGSVGACDASSGARDGVDGAKLGHDIASLAAHDRLLLVADGDAERLFRAKYASRTLVEAAPAGLDEARSVFARRRAVLPRGRRGPLVVCVDTSYSMAGGREAVAKAVALAACRVAAAQKRSGLVLAFGAADELAEVRCPGVGATAADVDRLLDFLERGFGGGTDVVGPLRRAVAAIERGEEGSSELARARRDASSFVNRHAIDAASPHRQTLTSSSSRTASSWTRRRTRRRWLPSTGSARRAGSASTASSWAGRASTTRRRTRSATRRRIRPWACCATTLAPFWRRTTT